MKKTDYTDEYFMAQALKEAKKAYKHNEVPIGCVVVKNNKILAATHNTRHASKNPLNHAEVTAIKRASKKIHAWMMDDLTIYVTVEPCLMCGGILLQSRIKRVVIGTKQPKFGAFGSIIDINSPEYKFNHKFEVTKGIKEEECANLMTSFFKKIRNKNKK